MHRGMIVIIDYGAGNLGSVVNMLKKIGTRVLVSSNAAIIGQAEKLILPGVGAFDQGMKNINDLGILPLLTDCVFKNRIPILGICLGMQLLTQKSEEGVLSGLGWIDAEAIRFNFDNKLDLKIPHMGWNTVKVCKDSPLFNHMYPDPRFYFVHSYYVVCRCEQDILTKTFHGYDFVSSFVKGNIVGVQFHPEKSHKFGMKFLKNFVESF
jgi:glutamine amidotransferase